MSLPTAEDPTPKAEDSAPVALPSGLVPLLKQRELEAYYGVSNWTVNEWIKAGMPIEPVSTEGRKRQRRFDLAAVKAWHAERVQLAATA